MTSVQLGLHRRTEHVPSVHQHDELEGLLRVLHSDAGEHHGLVLHQFQVADRPVPGFRHLHVFRQGVAAEDDAVVGFFWGHHRSSIVRPARRVNGGQSASFPQEYQP